MIQHPDFIVLRVILVVALGWPCLTVAADTTHRWDFKVFLGEKKIGRHVFEVTEEDGGKRVQSEANFKYTVLAIPVYRYNHVTAERWSGNCLTDITARTKVNGKRIEVSGKRNSSGFVVRNGENAVELPECIMTFAYWNPDFLSQSRLLNPQTGELLDVSVEKLGEEMLQVRGASTAATRFGLTAEDVDVTLWYSANAEWLALESVAKGGRVIRYELY